MHTIKLRCYSITHKPNQPADFNRYVNTATEKLWRFEYNPMIDIVANDLHSLAANDFVGIFSWKFCRKTKASKEDVYARWANAIEQHPDTEVFNLSPDLKIEKHGFTFMTWSEAGHKGITEMLMRCCNHLGLQFTMQPDHIIYSNQFIARKDIYQRYINEVILPLLELLEGKMWEEVNRNAGYTAGLKSSELKATTGLEHYNYVTFILERMMMMWVENQQLKTINLL